MTKIYIEDMTIEELTKVFNANSTLRTLVQDDMLDTEMFYISEQMDFFKDSLIDWSIGPYDRNYNYITIGNASDFIDGLEDAEKAIPVLIDEDAPLLEKAIEKRNELNEIEMYTDEFDEAGEALEAVAVELADIVLKHFGKSLEGCYDEEHQLEYFLEFYTSSRMVEETCYVDSEDFILKEDITKTYN